MKARCLAGLHVVPAAALLLGVWAEFADLGAPLLLAVAVPAIVVSTASAAYVSGAAERPAFVVLIGTLAGALTFAMTEGSYLALHLSRGGRLNFEGADSQQAMAAALLGIHVGVGALVGACVGVAMAC
jgi:hypothetical protein